MRTSKKLHTSKLRLDVLMLSVILTYCTRRSNATTLLAEEGNEMSIEKKQSVIEETSEIINRKEKDDAGKDKKLKKRN